MQTGTLTEDGLELRGVLPCGGEDDDLLLEELVEEPARLHPEHLLLWSLASCHSLTRIHNKYVPGTYLPTVVGVVACSGLDPDPGGSVCFG